MSTHNIPFPNMNHPKLSLNLQLWDLFQGTKERVRNSRGKRAISVRATEVLLYMVTMAFMKISPGQSVARLTQEPEVQGLIPSLATYLSFTC